MPVGWRGEPRRHQLARAGISTYRKDTKTKNRENIETTGIPYKEDLYPHHEGEWKNRYEKKRVELDYPESLKEYDRRLYNIEMESVETPEEKQDIFDRWQRWKKWQRGTHLHRPIANIEHGNSPYKPFYSTNANVPPPGYRWAEEDELEDANERILGSFDQHGEYEEYDEFTTIDDINKTSRDYAKIESMSPEDALQYLSKKKRGPYTKREKHSELQKELKKTGATSVPGEDELSREDKLRLSAHEQRRIEEMKERMRGK